MASLFMHQSHLKRFFRAESLFVLLCQFHYDLGSKPGTILFSGVAEYDGCGCLALLPHPRQSIRPSPHPFLDNELEIHAEMKQ